MLAGVGRRTRSGQAIVIMALAMVAICGMLALAIDAGRLYFQRRLMQDAVDSGALAGAQSLVGTVANPNGQPNYALYYALDDTLAVFNQNPANNDPNSSFYTAPINHTVTDSQGGYTVTAVAPTGYNNKQVQVTVSFNATATFVQVLGFQQIAILTTATAEAGTNAKTYALFAYTYGGSGNTIQNDQNGYAQVDDGFDGTDVCQASIQGLTVSNAKFHVPNPTQVSLNVNGDVTVNAASDNHSLFSFWNSPVNFGTGQDAKPDYLAPDTSLITTVINPTNKAKIAPGASGVVNGVTITNSSVSKWVYVFTPGRYTSSIMIPATRDNGNNSVYVFLNGIYFFTSGANMTITGGYVSNTSNGLPHFVPTGSTNIAFYITSTNGNNGSVWTETFNGSSSNVPRFQVWGTVFDADPSGSMTLTGVAPGPHNTSATDSNSSGQYAINGEFIGAFLQVNGGNVVGNSMGTPGCPGFTPGHPALLVQFNSKFAPAPGVNSYLVK